MRLSKNTEERINLKNGEYMDQDELIADMLKQYERYLSLLDDVGQELMAHEQTELAE